MTEVDNLFPRQDEFYNALMDAHAGLDTAQSHALNARLVLMLANELGDADRIAALLRKAREYCDD